MELCFKAEIARLNDTLLFSSNILLTYVENRYTLEIVINTIIDLSNRTVAANAGFDNSL